MRPLGLYMEEEKVICAFSVYVDPRAGDAEDMRQLILAGVKRMEGSYDTAEGRVDVEVRVSFSPKFNLGAVNVRTTDVFPVIRTWYDPRMNVSRAYIGTRRRGILKLIRYVFGKPDIYINLAGKDTAHPGNRMLLCSVVQHEFGHVLGFRDKYRYRRKTFSKRGGVDDGDIMYRVGAAQRFMEYHIRRLKGCALRGRLPFRSV